MDALGMQQYAMRLHIKATWTASSTRTKMDALGMRVHVTNVQHCILSKLHTAVKTIQDLLQKLKDLLLDTIVDENNNELEDDSNSIKKQFITNVDNKIIGKDNKK